MENSVIPYTHVLCLHITPDTTSEEVGGGQICQERVQEIMSTEEREDSTDSHTYTATGILSHSITT